jgi:uncharacterized protein YicC (UPF0701 family)
MKPSTSAGVRSMTGQGHATAQGDLGSLSVEVRTVNNRGLKCSARISDSLAGLESKIDALVRSLIHRGTVSISVSWRRPAGKDLPAIDQEALQAYAEQLQQVRHRMGDLGPHPGVERVHHLGAPQGHDGDAIGDLKRDCLVLHQVSPP